MSLERLKQQLKTREFDSLYVFWGEESYLRKYYQKALQDKCVPSEAADFNLHRLDGRQLDVDELEAAVESYPMMWERKLVVVDNLLPPVFQAKLADRLKLLLGDIPETTVCVFSYDSNVNLKDKKYASLMKLFQTCGATVVECGRPGEHDLARWVARHFAAAGKQVDMRDIQYMLQLCDNDMESLQNEIRKLCTFDTTGTITRRMMEEMLTRSVEATVYQLSDAITARNYDLAFRRLDDLFYLRTEPVLILGALASNFLTVYKVKTLQEAGTGREELVSLAGLRRPSLLSMYSRMASRLSLAELKNILEQLELADASLKGSRTPPRTVLECLIGNVLAFEQRQNKRRDSR
ncbi:MAG: DNA polymerase III subunit delta [Eubacteriales bacterium]|jgi:DNA polymerase-3 subunit delta